MRSRLEVALVYATAGCVSMLVSMAGLEACSSSNDSSPTPSPDASPTDAAGDASPLADDAPSEDGGAGATGPGQMIWFVSERTISLLDAVDGGGGLPDSYFNAPNVYVFSSDSTSGTVPPSSVASRTFTAAHSFATSCGDGGPRNETGIVEAVEAGLPPQVGAVLYDDESWCFTPSDEKSSPDEMAAAEKSASAAVRRARRQMLTAPAQDIVRAMGEFDGGTAERYLALGIPKIAAQNADVFEVQSQSLQPKPADFVAFVQQAAALARQANPNVKVVAGLSTNPSGGPIPSSYSLCQLVLQTRSVADGYWLNAPERGQFCENCSDNPHAAVAVNLLRQLKAGACDPSLTP